jgi:hypothetical protein
MQFDAVPAPVLEKRAEPIAEINDDIRKLATG